MRIAREIIETLKMELGFVKFENAELKLRAKLDSIDTTISTNISGISVLKPTIEDAAFKNSSLKISNIFFSNNVGSSIAVRKTENFPSILNINSTNFKVNIIEKSILPDTPDTPNVSESPLKIKFQTREGIIFYKDNNLPRFNKIDLNFPNLDLTFGKDMTIFKNFKNVSVSTISLKIHKKSVDGISIKSVATLSKKNIPFKTNIFPALLHAYYMPQDYVEKDILLIALNKLKEKYDITKIKFYAYYKNVPFEIVSSIKINTSKKMVIYFEKTKLVKFTNKSKELKNFLVFKYEDKFLYFPIEYS